MKSRIIALFIFSSGILFAQQEEEKSSFTLEEAKSYAAEHHLRIKNAELEYEESKKRVQETTAIGLPQLSASADYKYFINIPVSVVDARAFSPDAPAGETVAIEFGQNNNATANFYASQLLFDGSFIVGLQAAKTYKALKEQGINRTEIEVKDMVAQSYYNVLIAEENQKIFKENVEKLESQKKEISAIYNAGFIEEIEVDQIGLILSDAQKREKTIERQTKVAYQLLNFQMGRKIDSPLSLTEDLKTIYSNYDENALLNNEFQIQNHIDYQMIETQEHLRELQIKLDKASRLPKIAASYSYGQNAYDNILSEQTWYASSFVGVNVSMPIFTSTMNSSKLQQSKIQLNRLQNEKLIMEDNLNIQVSIARTSYIDALEQFQMVQKNLEISKKIFNITTTKQKSGLASSLDVTVANNQFLEIQGKYITALYQILDSKATLDKALNIY